MFIFFADFKLDSCVIIASVFDWVEICTRFCESCNVTIDYDSHINVMNYDVRIMTSHVVLRQNFAAGWNHNTGLSSCTGNALFRNIAHDYSKSMLYPWQ